jgi:hypothetical protein
MGRWLREPWDDAPATPAEKNTEVASLREQVAGLREALLRFTDWQDLSTTAYEARYGRDLGGGFANYYEAAMIHAHIALAAIPAPTPPEE